MLSVPVERGMRLIAHVEPMGAARMTQRGKWASESARRYMSHKEAVAWHWRKQWKEPTEAAVSVEVVFYMPIPKSYTKTKQQRINGQPHTKKPDIDNLIKACFDAANGIIWKDDNQVVRVEAEKRYSFEPRIEMIVTKCF